MRHSVHVSKERIVGKGDFRYRVHERWACGDTGGVLDGETGGIDFGVDGQVYVSRYNSGNVRILELDADGHLVRTIAEGQVTATHYVGVGPDGAVYNPDPLDHTLRKFSPTGELMMTLGTFNREGADGTPFNMPTKAVITAAGEIVVSDGYAGSYVHRFSPDGELLLTFGEPGNGPGQLHEPHGMELDPRDRVLVADRKNHRIQVFAAAGTWIDEWRHDWNLPHDVNLGPDDLLYVNDGSMEPAAGRITILDLDGNVVERFAAHDFHPPISSWMHGINVDRQGNLYVTDLDACHKLELL